MSATCLDTSAWVEITHAGPNARKFSAAVANAEALFVSTISLYEITKYTNRVADEGATEEILMLLRQYLVTPVSDEIATLAATLGTRHKLAMADALIYATALAHQATLWTQNEEFKGLPHVKFFPRAKQ